MKWKRFFVLLILLLLSIFSALTVPGSATPSVNSSTVESSSAHRPSSSYSAVRSAVSRVFGGYAGQAMHVVRCETGGTYSVWASNGQYQGLFQMGNWERRTYGHGSTALAQAKAAYRYFVASGRDWSPWDPKCRP